MKFYLAREGVAFGPYTEFQVLESVRLGIFESNDLALAENGKEWLEISQLLPVNGASREQAPEKLPEEAAEKLPGKSSPPVAEYHLQEHAALFSEPPVASFATEFSRRKSIIAVSSAAGAAVCLLTLLAVLHHRKAPAQAGTIPRSPAKPAAMKTLAKVVPPLAPVAPPVRAASPASALRPAAPEKPAAPVPAIAPAAPAMASPAPGEEVAANQPPAAKIEGRMLIATANGLEYEPSSVEVRLYPLAQLKPYLEKRASEASAKFEELKSRIEAAEADKERMRKASDAAFDAYTQAEAGSPNKAALEKASVEAKKARETATNAYYNLMQSREDLLSGAFYLDEMPKPIEVTQTDSQGRFSFGVPAEGDFAVVAGVERSENDATKRYYWFIPVSVASEPTKEVLLSNNNLSSQGSADSLVLTID